MKKRGFKLDYKKCLGCQACVIACKQQNKSGKGIGYRRIISVNPARTEELPAYNISIACNHCEKPKCLEACTNEAYAVREDGVVVHDSSKCKGCRDCISACPYEAPQFDEIKHQSSKCNLCIDVLEDGDVPFCVQSCPTGALNIIESSCCNECEWLLEEILEDMNMKLKVEKDENKTEKNKNK